MKSNIAGNNDTEDFHDAQDDVPTPDKQPDQEGKVINVNPVEIEASQTRLITTAVGKLVMNPEERTRQDQQKRTTKLATEVTATPLNCSLEQMTVTMKSKKHMTRNKMRYFKTNMQTQILSLNTLGTKQAPT